MSSSNSGHNFSGSYGAYHSLLRADVSQKKKIQNQNNTSIIDICMYLAIIICRKIFLPYKCLIDISLFFHYKVFTNENPLFCIIDTNSKEAFTYLDREPVNNVTYFESMKARHKAFIWPSSSLEGPRKTTNESKDTHYRAGDAVLTFDKGQEISETKFLALISSKKILIYGLRV